MDRKSARSGRVASWDRRRSALADANAAAGGVPTGRSGACSPSLTDPGAWEPGFGPGPPPLGPGALAAPPSLHGGKLLRSGRGHGRHGAAGPRTLAGPAWAAT